MRHLFLCAVLLAPVTAAADPADEILAAITSITAGADREDWDRVRAALADEVTLDYTSLWGGDASTLAAEDIVAQWSSFLPGFDITHHMVTNRTITSMADNAATAEADFTATHRIGEDLWVLGGQYSYELTEVAGDWRVSALTMTALWETGDRGLVEVAMERASAAGN